MEILAPAGDLETARTAFVSGADAVYLGMSRFSAREGAANFQTEELQKITAFAHLLEKRVYVCLNTLVKDSELSDFFASARTAYECGADAILVQDLFLGRALKELYPQIELHLSTQAGCCNERGALLAKEYGFSRVVLARETPLEEIKAIAKIVETEVFVQGALCACFSGQCYFSSFAGNNSGNRGRCKQPCRKLYSIDRKGYEEYAYALSPSDLCLGKRLKELSDAGVVSFKIEGRMRRKEYVAAAVQYYRAALQGQDARGELSRLKRAYNRGDYTEGLAFGEKNFLSRDVQGHIGEEVGLISFAGNRPFCKSVFRASKGDGFKILRQGKEVGGARFLKEGEGGFFLECDSRVRTGDSVRVTTDTAAGERLLSYRSYKEIPVSVTLVAGEYPVVESGDFSYTGGETVPAAKSAPLTKEEIARSFCKVGDLPFSPLVSVNTQNAFLPKSALNELRRAFYEELARHLAPARAPLPVTEKSVAITPVKGALTAAITADGATNADIDIFKAEGTLPVKKNGLRFLYLPAYFTRRDEARMKPLIEECDGIYCEGYYGISLAEDYNKPLFAGTGFNVTNAVSVAGVKEAGAKYFALSKELSDGEQRALCAEGAFALSAGDIKIMDLLFCPFSRTCDTCDRRAFYTLTDGDQRKFPLRRYGSAGACRFELFNCAPLAAYNGESNALVDITAMKDKALIGYARSPEGYLKNATGGHKNRSMQ